MNCSLCESRKAKRMCPAVRSEICPQCCGKEREETLLCPLDCPYLTEAREHEKHAGPNPESVPFKEIRVTENFLRSNEELLNSMGRFVAGAAAQTPGAVDRDVRDALDALARTYKSLESGLYYQSMPQSPVAAAIAAQVQELVRQFRAEETQSLGMTRTRDADVLGVLVFLLRMAIDEDNGRRLGRRFIDKLYQHFRPAEPDAAQQPLIVPG